MTRTVAPIPEGLAAASELAATLAKLDATFPDGNRGEGRQWPQSLAGGAAGVALMHVELARAGHGDWATARTWLAAAARERVTAASNAGLFFWAPALALVFHIAASSTGKCQRALATLDDATASITRTSLDAARNRMDRGVDHPLLREFDLIRGLAGLGAYQLAAHPGHELTRDVLACLVRLTEPLPGTKDDLPPWWTCASPSGDLSAGFPGGHGNLGMSHGISAVLAVLSLAIICDVTVPGAEGAVRRICTWSDQWRQEGEGGPWWPGVISLAQARAQCVDPGVRSRPSWCYGSAGTARAQQLAGMALRDTPRQQVAEAAILAALRDPGQLALLTEAGLCHGTAGLLQAAWRMAGDSTSGEIEAELPRIATRLTSQLAGEPHGNHEFLDGAAGAALALHAIGTGNAPAPSWDTFLALA